MRTKRLGPISLADRYAERVANAAAEVGLIQPKLGKVYRSAWSAVFDAVKHDRKQAKKLRTPSKHNTIKQ